MKLACWRCSGVKASSHLLAAVVIAAAARLEVDRCEASVTPAPQAATNTAARARRGNVLDRRLRMPRLRGLLPSFC